MRLKQLLGIVLLAMATASMAAATVSQDNVADGPPQKAGAISRISGVSVVRGADTLNIEISGSSPMAAKTMRLAHPDRVVVDIPNSLLQGHAREIAVNSGDVRSVRAARYQVGTTRVVVDMAHSAQFQIVPEGNKLVVKLHDGATSAKPVPLPEPKQAVVAATQSGQPDVSQFFVTSPATATALTEKSEATPVEATPSRAELAASHFAHDAPPLPSINKRPFEGNASLAAQPAAINAALQQQTQQPAQPQALPQPVPPAPQGAAQTTPAGTTVAVSAPATGNCTTGRYTGEPFGMNFKDLDLKDFFRLIHEISGLNVVLDPSVKGTVTIVLDDVPWDQALAIVLDNNGLACTLQGNVLRIATLETMKTEAEARRAQQEAQALAVPKQTITRYLSYGHARDAATIVKKFLSARGDVVADDRSNALIIEDIPSVLPKVEDLIRMLDRKAPEVEIEARVVASTRTFARDIGTQLGFGFGSGNNAVGGATANSPIKVTLPPGQVPRFITGAGDATSIPLFSNLGATGPTSGIEFNNTTAGFRLDFILTAAENRGLLKILSRPTITVQNNISALIRQGSRIPVVTQAQLGGPPTVTYVDAFLRLTVTPQITSENTIFLNVDVENTVPDFSRVSGSQLNPTLNTQQATTQVLVTDGGTVVIGGVIQTQNSVAIAQVPLLGSIPLLGNLFKHTNVNTSTAELIFFITPKIIQT
jgi:type IV pilus assembly protein PilQ